MAREISNSEDMIDSSDVIARIDELEGLVTDLTDQIEDADKDDRDIDTLDEELIDIQDELEPLVKLQEQADGYAADWQHGEALIRDSYFQEYAKQLAEDTCEIGSNASWPLSCIDWEQAAEELQQDYTPVEFDGETYWIK